MHVLRNMHEIHVYTVKVKNKMYPSLNIFLNKYIYIYIFIYLVLSGSGLIRSPEEQKSPEEGKSL